MFLALDVILVETETERQPSGVSLKTHRRAHFQESLFQESVLGYQEDSQTPYATLHQHLSEKRPFSRGFPGGGRVLYIVLNTRPCTRLAGKVTGV